ncbi:MAG: hypothetical protein ABSC47_01450 [Terracidiphilus sp.]
MIDSVCMGFVMNRVTVALQNCYGIKKLAQQFDFSQNRVFAIYAPNGAMKSSFAQTFQDVATGSLSTDRIFPTRASTRKITDEHDHDLPKESIFVVRPYDEEFGHTEKTSTLLLDAKLRKEYEQLYLEIDQAKEALLKALKEQSHSKKPLEQEVSIAFTSTNDGFYTALHRIRKELEDQKDTPFADVEYDTIFDERVLKVLGTKDVRTALEGYIQRYNELLAASTFFKKGTFDYYNAGQIAKSLANNGFFAANHSVNLYNGERLEIRTQKELEAVIAKEKDAILKDIQLRKRFDEIATMLEKNETLRDFQSYMLDHEAFLSQLSNVDKFKQEVWKSYLKVKYDLYLDLISKHENAQRRQKEIEDEAAKQRTQWEEVIQIFNDRFFVPFKLEVKNRTAVMLGNDRIINLGFTYHDGNDNTTVPRDALLKCLSTGELRALYILNVIFEIEVRKKAKQETLMVIDDIADSFDYQNKYAIIQYLKDVHDDPQFKQIIMTHNFDFFRTVNSRFVQYSHCLMASKSSTGIALDKASGIKNIFVNDWKKEFFTDDKKRIASIPFLRNLVEFTKGEGDPNFAKLTSLLHCKADSASITNADLDAIFNDICGSTEASADGKKAVVDTIKQVGAACLKSNSDTFESKIVLAIAIRLAAESFMIAKINDPAFVAGLVAHQTQELFVKFKTQFPTESKAIEVLDRVQIMTPENIHLNSFMYEPIVDMSGDHLRKLYADTLAL